MDDYKTQASEALKQVFIGKRPPVIICAAARIKSNDVYLIVCSPRHYDRIAHAQIAHMGNRDLWRHAEEGFVDQYGNFYDRKQAWDIAVKNGQIVRDHDKCPGTLYSEHLY